MSLPRGPLPATRRWTIGNQPTFMEAHPTISIGDCHRQVQLGKDHLLWRHRDLIIAGAAAVRWPSRDGIELRYRVEEGIYLDAAQGELLLRVTWKGSTPDNKRPFAICPTCDRHVDVLASIDRWSCRTCHALGYPSAQLSEACRWSEEVRELNGAIAIVEAGHASGGKAHDQRVERRDLLMARLNERLVTANALLLATIKVEWGRPLSSSLPPCR